MSPGDRVLIQGEPRVITKVIPQPGFWIVMHRPASLGSEAPEASTVMARLLP